MNKDMIDYAEVWFGLDDVVQALVNHEFEYAHLKIEQLLDENEQIAHKKHLQLISDDLQRLFLAVCDTNDLDILFGRAFFHGIFFADYFLLWTNNIVAQKVFELSSPQQLIIQNFFISEAVKNQDKTLVLEILYLLKIDLPIIYTNNLLKTVDQLQTTQLDQVEMFQQKSVVKTKLEQLTHQDPSLQKLVLTCWNNLYFYCFPSRINFDVDQFAQALVLYVQAKLNVDKLTQYNALEPKLKQFLDTILN